MTLVLLHRAEDLAISWCLEMIDGKNINEGCLLTYLFINRGVSRISTSPRHHLHRHPKGYHRPRSQVGVPRQSEGSAREWAHGPSTTALSRLICGPPRTQACYRGSGFDGKSLRGNRRRWTPTEDNEISQQKDSSGTSWSGHTCHIASRETSIPWMTASIPTAAQAARR